ncbi:DNA-directed RNA polymerases I and III subunit RPAC2 [Apodemus speciosus]|uniref:DNA-directed RNA polymerases I and III subunit RPAC2 n=1 Tax=Apodemus speciosus TaxID=105296 RepID=A0ABQ0EUN8_APOSI
MEDDQELERESHRGIAKGGKAWENQSRDDGADGLKMKCPLAGTNKRFLINTIKNTLPSHKEQDHEQKEGGKEPGSSQDQKEAGGKKHRSHAYKRSLHSSRSVGCSPPRKRASRDKCDPRPSRR